MDLAECAVRGGIVPSVVVEAERGEGIEMERENAAEERKDGWRKWREERMKDEESVNQANNSRND